MWHLKKTISRSTFGALPSVWFVSSILDGTSLHAGGMRAVHLIKFLNLKKILKMYFPLPQTGEKILK
jgi:hypothetical protein